MTRPTPLPGALEAITRDPLIVLGAGAKARPPVLHPCAPLGGLCIVGGDSQGIVWTALGLQRCRFTIPGADALSKGTRVRVGVPAEPFFDGLAWAAGQVQSVTADPDGEGRLVEVALRERDGRRPTIYERVVRHWAERSEALAG